MYTIENFHYGLCPNQITDVKEFFELRKKFIKITSVKWIVCGVEIDPYYIDATYTFKFPILIFLN